MRNEMMKKVAGCNFGNDFFAAFVLFAAITIVFAGCGVLWGICTLFLC